MVASAEARRLTQIHHQLQARLGLDMAHQMTSLWKLIDPTNLDGTTRPWLRAAIPAIAAQRATSADVATNYLKEFRKLSVGSSAIPDVTLPALVDAQVSTSLMVTGPYRVMSAMARGEDLATAADLGRGGSAASSVRYALEGGREMVMQTAAADPEASGWQRVASDSACDFCLQLVDWSEGNAALRSDFQAHDGCSCSAEPVY